MTTFDTFRANLAALTSQLDQLTYEQLRAQYAQHQTTFELELSALPQHEQKLANRELHDLHKKIEKKKPKKSFSLKKKTKLVVRKEEELEKEKEEEEKSNIEIDPIYADLSDETRVYQCQNHDASLLIKNVAKCNITINGPCSSFTLENASNCIITLNDITTGAAMVRDATDCRIQLTARQLRVRNCHRTRFAIAVCSKVALEESTGLLFGPHPAEEVIFLKILEFSGIFRNFLEFFGIFRDFMEFILEN